MAKLEILKAEEKVTPTGKKLKKLMIEQEGRQYPYKNVTVWSNHPLYERISPGFKLEGTIEGKDSGIPNPKAQGKNYVNYTLLSGDAPTPSVPKNDIEDLKHRVQLLEKFVYKKEVKQEAEEILPEDEVPF